ncbi:double-strand break repair protein AddB [Pseudotabrizicola sp. L79]|uniref:double-strand break repair protein AddB n=1 Tax=Pseudotabrizicola sp. L79 TaxID=3118402 RepID=UPI002F945B48
MFTADMSRVFGLPPGVDFPRALVDGLRARMAGQPPQAMGRVTLYLNSARMQRRVRDLMAASGPGILPRLRLVTDLGADFILPGLPPAVPALRRKLQLTVLIARLLDKEPDLAPRAAIADLAQSLSDLLAEMQVEGVSPDRIADLDVADFSAHWERTRQFLMIVAPFFANPDQPDSSGRQRLLAQHLAGLWAMAPAADPVIVAGSTGSRGTTALFMQAVARLPQGAVILPGVDMTMPSPVWDRLDDALTSEDHPQFRFRRFADMMGLHPSQISAWTAEQPPSPERNRVISLALRPAPVTDQWLVEGQDLPPLPQALRDLTLIEAKTPRQEALALALILRQAANSGRKAALISPDRSLTRQVTAALARWGVLPDDSAGVPLNQSPPGRFLRQITRLFCQRLASDRLLALLKHPLTASAIARGDHLLLTRNLELRLRSKGPVFPTGADLLAWGGSQKGDLALGWATALAGAIDGLATTGRLPLAAHVRRLRQMAERLARGPAAEGTGGLWDKAAGKEAQAFLTELETEAEHGGDLTAGEFRDLFDDLISSREVRDAVVAHPTISIWGTIEARVQGADLVLLAGLNDGIWPALPPADPWLNRKMRQQAGLLLPERRIGLAAHDFQQAIAAPEVVLSRALRNAEAETVPSRWVNRLVNLVSGLPDRQGPQALAEMRARGQTWLNWASAVDRPQRNPGPALRPAKRPAPRPPVAHRPKELSLTRVELLIRDPYAIYASKILRLDPMNSLKPMPEARDRGIVIHEVLERFVRDRPEGETRDAARTRLLALTQDVLAAEVPWPAERILWAARMRRAADHFLDVDADQGGTTLRLETKGELILQELGFRLFGTPDRIDRLEDGTLHLMDYKTGTPPSAAQIASYAKQLHLAALLAEAGGFGGLGPQTVSRISYIGLAGDGKLTSMPVTEASLTETRDGLMRLIRSYMTHGQGYIARRAVQTEQSKGDFDHLARFGEWEMTDASVPEDVGPEDVGPENLGGDL